MGRLKSFVQRQSERLRLASHRFRPLKSIFTSIDNKNLFGGDSSRSGPGSDLSQTAAVREALPPLLKELGIQVMLDVPCGDFFWMKEVELGAVRYIGGDIVPRLVAENNKRYGSAARSFVEIDLTTGPLLKAELVFCRDCLVHLSYKHLHLALRNVKSSGAKYLLTTTFPSRTENKDIISGEWRPINLEAPPFSLGKPARLISERCTENNGAYADKSLGLWKLSTGID